MADKRGLLFIVCGPSGAGKTSLCAAMLSERRKLKNSVSYTTRPPRGEERMGSDYHFVDIKTFEALVEDEALAEWARVHGHYYGTPVEGITDAWDEQKDVLFDIDYQGANQLKSRFGDQAVTVMVAPPNLNILLQRLRKRGTDAEDVIERRMRAAVHELKQVDAFDFLVKNDDFESALQALKSIYDGSAFRQPLQRQWFDEMLGQSAL